MKTIVRPARLLLVAIPVLLGAATEKPAFLPKEGASQIKKFSVESEMTLEDMTVEMNGTDVSSMAGDVEMGWKVAQTLAVTDHYEGTADGRPSKLRRSYDEIRAQDPHLGLQPGDGRPGNGHPREERARGHDRGVLLERRRTRITTWPTRTTRTVTRSCSATWPRRWTCAASSPRGTSRSAPPGKCPWTRCGTCSASAAT
jgi:hypothetical protein